MYAFLLEIGLKLFPYIPITAIVIGLLNFFVLSPLKAWRNLKSRIVQATTKYYNFGPRFRLKGVGSETEVINQSEINAAISVLRGYAGELDALVVCVHGYSILSTFHLLETKENMTYLRHSLIGWSNVLDSNLLNERRFFYPERIKMLLGMQNRYKELREWERFEREEIRSLNIKGNAKF